MIIFHGNLMGKMYVTLHFVSYLGLPKEQSGRIAMDLFVFLDVVHILKLQHNRYWWTTVG